MSSHVLVLCVPAFAAAPLPEAARSAPPVLRTATTFVGTVTYMSPERIAGRAYSYASDVWALGLTLLTTALGKLPLDTRGGYWSVLSAVRDDAPPALSGTHVLKLFLRVNMLLPTLMFGR